LKDLGELNVAIKFEPREDSLQIRVNEISGLPKYALTGLPGKPSVIFLICEYTQYVCI